MSYSLFNNNNNNTPSTLACVYVAMGRAHSIQSNGCEETRPIGTGCTPREELNSQQGEYSPMVQKRSGRPTPVFRPQYHDVQDS